MIVHCSHHKTGTVLFRDILSDMAKHFAYRMFFFRRKKHGPEFYERTGQPGLLCLDASSYIDLTSCKEGCILSHMVRDPREILVSAYNYHLVTDEAWCIRPVRKYGGKSYQEYLRSLPKEEGISAELQRLGEKAFPTMSNWNYDDPRVLELRFEEITRDFDGLFERVFRFYGFTGTQLHECMEIARRHDLKKSGGSRVVDNKHVTNKNFAEERWRSELSDAHKAEFKRQWGHLLIKLGYERDTQW